ncbi:hypothetical protein ACOSQ2_028127 [Xanthoceras sorbifolium]
MAITSSAIAKVMLQSQYGFGCVKLAEKHDCMIQVYRQCTPSDKRGAMKFPPSMPFYKPPNIKPKLGTGLGHGGSLLEKQTNNVVIYVCIYVQSLVLLSKALAVTTRHPDVFLLQTTKLGHAGSS